MAWTSQQEMAINARNCSVIVSAAAGSGKTAVLVERLVSMLTDKENPVRADRMIIATFTNDAASELRQRLNLKLLGKINEEPENLYLLKQYTLLQNAKISTINSFCFDLLRDNISNQGITSDFSVLDESIDKLITNEALEETLDLWCRNRKSDIEFLYDKFCIKNDSNLIALICEADKFLSSLAMPDLWLEKTLDELNKPLEDTIYYKRLKEENSERLKTAIKLAEENIELIPEIFYDDTPQSAKAFQKSEEQAENDLILTKHVSDVLNGSSPESIKNKIAECISFERIVTVKKDIQHDENLRNIYKSNRSELTALVKKCFSQVQAIETDVNEVRDIFSLFKEMIEDYHKILWNKKTEKNAINFNDGERLALELLADTDQNGHIVQSQTAESISDYYDIIMIDEYQDSNDKQDLIFKLISKNYKTDKNGVPCYGDNAFLVGDVKQSIYKFRLANPQNFIYTLNSSSEFSYGTHNTNTFIKLNKNFRSSKHVIDFVNYIFCNIMSKNCGDIVYDESEMLYFGSLNYKNDTDNEDNKTEIMLINETDEEADAEKPDNSEACITAKKIFEMIENKVLVRVDEHKTRPCEAKDFCILVRKNKYTSDYIKELQKLGINAKGEEEKGYLKSREVMVLLDLLRIIDNPLLDISITAVMMSPMYMFTAQDLAEIRIADKDSYIYLIIEKIVSGEYEVNNALREKCTHFLNSLYHFRLQAVTLSAEELIKNIYDMTDFITVMQLYTDGEKKRANLRFLINYAHNYETGYNNSGGVSGFIRYIDRIIAMGDDFSQGKISASSDNYVSVKTMHKSKGLEYPFIFLVETETAFRNDYPQVLMSTDNRVGFVVNNPETVRRYRTIPYTQILEKNKADICSEEMRLFYVALTRAKQKLFLLLKADEKQLKRVDALCCQLIADKNNIRKTAEKASSISDWLWLCLISHRKFKKICEQLDYEFTSCPDFQSEQELFGIDFYCPQLILQQHNQEKQKYYPDTEIIKEIKSIWDMNYDTELSTTPAKLSVTQIAKKVSNIGDFLNCTLKRPDFKTENTSLTGTERGTAIHTFLQYCDFENAISDIENEIWNMIDKGYISESEGAVIPRKKIIAFFQSSLYKRIKSADKVYREMKFMIALDELDFNNEINQKFKNSHGMIKGIMDLVFQEDDMLVLVDYKSDRGNNAQKLKEKYSLQMNLYKQALEIITSMPVKEVYLYSVEIEKEILL